MNKILLIPVITISLIIYFSLTILFLPEQYMSKEQFVPIPYLKVELSNYEIILGESFRLNILSENRGDYGDIHIVSTSFPSLENIEGIVEIVSYDFTHAPRFIIFGEEIGSKYSGGLESVNAKYASIEAMSRPIPPGLKYHMDLVITPKEIGPFIVYIKSVDIPHTNSKSHFPNIGTLDHQDEYVLVYRVNVNP